MNSLVERLRTIPTQRTWDSVGRPYDYPAHLPLEAADRIEELERQNVELLSQANILSELLSAAIEDYNDARHLALEEAAKEIERIAPTVEARERQVPVTDDFGEVVGHFIDPAGERKRFITGKHAAAAIRALAVSSHTLLQEQSANSGKEGE